MGCWHGYLSGARCRLAYGPADATVAHSLSLASVKSRLVLPLWYWLTRGSPGQRAVKRVCVCVYGAVLCCMQFVSAATDICEMLHDAGFWADFLDPASGGPVSPHQ